MNATFPIIVNTIETLDIVSWGHSVEAFPTFTEEYGKYRQVGWADYAVNVDIVCGDGKMVHYRVALPSERPPTGLGGWWLGGPSAAFLDVKRMGGVLGINYLVQSGNHNIANEDIGMMSSYILRYYEDNVMIGWFGDIKKLFHPIARFNDSEIKIASLPNKTAYKVDEAIDYTGVSVALAEQM